MSMRSLIKDLESLAFQMKAPNEFTPQFLMLAVQMRLCIRPARDKDLDGAQPKSALPGLSPRGKPMPQTREEWAYLGSQYDKAMNEQKDENSRLRVKISDQCQRIEKLRRTINQRNIANHE